jgi:hypothetical protein
MTYSTWKNYDIRSSIPIPTPQNEQKRHTAQTGTDFDQILRIIAISGAGDSHRS